MESQDSGSGREVVSVPFVDYDHRDEEGKPTMRYMDIPAEQVESEMAQEHYITEQKLLAQLPFIDHDLHNLEYLMARSPAAMQSTEVPGHRIISNPVELDLIGKGLPVVQGPEWPQAYWDALKSLGKGQAVTVPRPHPKFDVSDMARVAEQGPLFRDVLLQHAERVTDETAVAYNYIPPTVLGDWSWETEPQWLQTPFMSVPEFWLGLRARNWTAGTHYQPQAVPWRVQLFQCGHSGPTQWKGVRALVTVQEPLTAPTTTTTTTRLRSKASQKNSIAPGTAFWVDMPDPGLDAPLNGHSLPHPGLAGYEAVLTQLYQAYDQRLSKAAKRQLHQQGYIEPGHPYSCPSDRLLNVSWHITPNPLQNPLHEFLINPSLPEVTRWMKTGIESSGILELKTWRDRIMFQIGPDPVEINMHFDPNNAGPLYFVVCLTLGIVIPALRRNRILDIKTLEEDPGAAMEFARSKSTARKEGLTGVEFKDVAGLGPILSEVMEVVEFLKDPKAFSMLGARPPKGMLMEGDPGTGKTLLAKALAGEAMVPFYQMTGTEFTEGIVGVGAARVRDLFKRARANAPCVMFVDELDALGLKRAEGDGSGKVNEEREQTLNQLLTEMDGFTPDTGVVFLGATNRADLLDPALMRPGRFDRKIRMPKPDTEGRFEILQLHLRNKTIAADVDLLQLARDLPGLVGADLANVVNEAQLAAVRDGRQIIGARDMYAGVDRFTQGEKRPALPTTYKLPIMAFAAREVGVALVAETLRSRHGRIEAVERVSIQPKGRSISRTLFARGTDEEYMFMTRGRLLDRIRVALAGHIAVRCVVGEETNFSISDIKKAGRLASKLIFYYGMSELGITTWAAAPYSTDFAIGSSRPRKVVSTDGMDEYADWPTRNEDFRFGPMDPSDPTWHRYTDEVRKVIKGCYEEVWAILEERKGALQAGVDALSEKREMLGYELRDVFDEHPAQPLTPEQMPKLDEMIIFTDKAKGRDVWPFGIPWLNDAYPIPYWVKQEQKGQGLLQRQQKETAAV